MPDRSANPLTCSRPEDLRWLVGSWCGEVQEESVDEHWHAPAFGMMYGCFRWARSGGIWLLELMTIDQVGPHTMLRLKHFDRNLCGWENRDECKSFALVESSNNWAVFLQRETSRPVWLIYEREGDLLNSWFESEDHLQQTIFRYRLSAVP